MTVDRVRKTDHGDPVGQLRDDGYCVLSSVFNADELESFRTTTVANLAMMGNTRSAAHSYHLAGFHRFASFRPMHDRIVSNLAIGAFLSSCFQGSCYNGIGLSDITVNRSQHWHTDLLRGRYSKFLQGIDLWPDDPAPGCVKILVYLQDGSSLGIVTGSHRHPSPLDDALIGEMARPHAVRHVTVKAGDVVAMDIRALHRGSSDADMSEPALAASPRILVSSVFGSAHSDLAHAMRLGNEHRMADWDRQFLPVPVPAAN